MADLALVDLVVPVKHLDRAKSRLRGAVPGGLDAHRALVLAVVSDTIGAALAAPGVRRVLVVCEDSRVVEALAGTGAECVDERGLPGLNAALRFGARRLRADDPRVAVGALQADLPAARPSDIDEAITEADGRRAFVADRPGTGTALLIGAPGEPLAPRFGQGSATAHARDAARVGDHLPYLRCDVDTPDDLTLARDLGLGPRTARVLEATCRVC
ncbi:2-phospho-L-lactate guanylyltransferase [Actinokineospora auranticolor]|uniref:Phosphoenolpyruvate guanylyltransferase n=1 Tax=Actinokineospora auranticolor TaxID=155976 RepID=A0A2S6GGG3_9PSEU|nr:2-phospho-L-lactate guanylyltransferase [Actinokineospora auranticolor]PPK64328.1 2-phospho-L-lactate guanylyltransferase [Actinokineospora auranticolor]